jgi:hypothetical protein
VDLSSERRKRGPVLRRTNLVFVFGRESVKLERNFRKTIQDSLSPRPCSEERRFVPLTLTLSREGRGKWRKRSSSGEEACKEEELSQAL